MSAPLHPTAALRAAAVAAALALTVALGACGADARDDRTVVVSAAASLKQAFTAYAEAPGPLTPRFSFGGSDLLAAQLRAGLRPDVFAAANTRLPQELHAAGLVERPRVLARGRLVLAVPAGSRRVRSLTDLTGAGVTIAAGSPSVPVGAYTRRLLARLGPAQSRAILANLRSSEPDVAGVVGKLTQGAVDAGFVYATDVRATGGRLTAIELPARLEPHVAYGIAVVVGAAHPAAARAFVAGLLAADGAGQRALRTAGFEPPPS